MAGLHEAQGNVRRSIRWNSPTPAELANLIRQRMRGGHNPILSAHAGRDRLEQRGFSLEDVHRILSVGFPYKAERGTSPGEWKVNIALSMNGRDAAVVALLSPTLKETIILTVMWMSR